MIFCDPLPTFSQDHLKNFSGKNHLSVLEIVQDESVVLRGCVSRDRTRSQPTLYRNHIMNVKLCLVGIVSLVVMGCAGQIAADPSESAPTQENINLQEIDPVQMAESPVASPEPIQVAAEVVTSGEFESGEHPTQGTVQIIQQEGRTIVELGDSFQTSRGPDLFVILHRSPDVIGSTTPPDYPIAEGDYVTLSPLAAPTGMQRYEIPADINLEDYASVAIWCRQFNATFGSARLQ
jgi:hypothetical protein